MLAIMDRRRFVMTASAVALAKPTHAASLAGSELRDVTWIGADDAASAEYSTAYARTHVGIPARRALCASATGVQNAVRWARDQGLGFAVRSGGHCFAGLSQHSDLVIDQRQLNAIHFDAAAQTVTVGAGTHLGTLAHALAGKGASIPGGICPTVAMSGYALGGGIGYLGRRDGLLIDQLKSLKIVTAHGDLLTASATKNPDLFWACRGGGGGNFGIVTELTFRVQPIQPMHWVRMVEPADAVRTAEILFLWQHRVQTYPRHTTLHLRLTRRTDTTFLVLLEGLSGWSEDTLRTELAHLMRTSTDVAQHGMFTGTPAQLVQRMMPDAGNISSDLLSHSHLFDGPVGERGTLDILSELLNHPKGRVNLNIEPLGGAIADVAPDATAFVHRKTSFAVQSQILLQPSDDKAALMQANEAMRAVLQPLANGGVYVNYPDLTLVDWGRKYWGANLPRLKAIKRKYDPDAIFTHRHSLNHA